MDDPVFDYTTSIVLFLLKALKRIPIKLVLSRKTMPYPKENETHTDATIILKKPPCIKTQHHEYKRKQMEDVYDMIDDNGDHFYNLKNKTIVNAGWD